MLRGHACADTAPRHDTAGRLLPCLPRGALPAVFFLHIPKTAGSSVNAALHAIYGPLNHVRHLEMTLPDLMEGRVNTLRADCVAGHLPLAHWRALPGAETYGLVTVLRRPWRRLVSHLNWVDSYRNRRARLKWDATARAALAALDEVDFDNRASLLRFRDRLDAVEGQHPFSNYQTRLLAPSRPAIMAAPLFARDVERAAEVLEEALWFGFSEDLRHFLDGLSNRLGLPAIPDVPRENTAPARRLSPANDIAREVLGGWFFRDVELYRRARAIRAAD